MGLLACCLEKCYKEISGIRKGFRMGYLSDIFDSVEFSTFFKVKGLLRLHRVYSLHLS